VEKPQPWIAFIHISYIKDGITGTKLVILLSRKFVPFPLLKLTLRPRFEIFEIKQRIRICAANVNNETISPRNI
jgi:hypothetical protein